MDGFMRALVSVWTDSGFAALTWENCVMILVGLVLLYLSIAKEYEPLLLLPIAFGCIMANFPNTGFEDEMGVMMAIGFGIKYEIFPPLIFMGVGAMTDFGPLIANPKTMLLGAAAQIGVFVALAGAMLLGFNVQEAASIGIIGGADGPTAIYLTSKLAPHLLGAIAVAAYMNWIGARRFSMVTTYGHPPSAIMTMLLLYRCVLCISILRDDKIVFHFCVRHVFNTDASVTN